MIKMATNQKNIFIIPDIVEPTDNNIQKYLKKKYKKIFATILNNWYTDEKMWPNPVSFEIFNNWFDIEHNDSIFDLTGFIEKMI